MERCSHRRVSRLRRLSSTRMARTLAAPRMAHAAHITRLLAHSTTGCVHALARLPRLYKLCPPFTKFSLSPSLWRSPMLSRRALASPAHLRAHAPPAPPHFSSNSASRAAATPRDSALRLGRIRAERRGRQDICLPCLPLAASPPKPYSSSPAIYLYYQQDVTMDGIKIERMGGWRFTINAWRSWRNCAWRQATPTTI